MGRKKHGVNNEIDGLIREVLLPLEVRSDVISPVFIASEVEKRVDPENIAPGPKTHGFLMYVRERARALLASRHDPVKQSEDDAQMSMFKGLQPFYPRSDGAEYVRREHMVEKDYIYNIKRLFSEAKTKTEHAKALEAEYEERLSRGDFSEVA
jgi:hypothetical protein